MGFSPLQVFISYFVPAALADGKLFTLKDYVNSNVVISAIFVPRVSTMLHDCGPPLDALATIQPCYAF